MSTSVSSGGSVSAFNCVTNSVVFPSFGVAAAANGIVLVVVSLTGVLLDAAVVVGAELVVILDAAIEVGDTKFGVTAVRFESSASLFSFLSFVYASTTSYSTVDHIQKSSNV
jgi:hypothetical protein